MRDQHEAWRHTRAMCLPEATPNPAPLEAVAEAAEQRRQASHDYLAALREAKQAGHSLQAIADQAGVTKQAVRQIVERGERNA